MTNERLAKINSVAEDIKQLEKLSECIESGVDMEITIGKSYFLCPFWLKMNMLSVITAKLAELRMEFESL